MGEATRRGWLAAIPVVFGAARAQTQSRIIAPEDSFRIIRRSGEWFVLIWLTPGYPKAVMGRCFADMQRTQPTQGWVVLGLPGPNDAVLLSGPFGGDPPAGFAVRVTERKEVGRG